MSTFQMINLERISPLASRKQIERWLLLPLVVGALSLMHFVPIRENVGAGLFLLSLSLLLLSKLLDFYFASNVLSITDQSFLAQYILSESNIWQTFCSHSISQEVFSRVGISSKDLKETKDIVIPNTGLETSKDLFDLLGKIFDANDVVKSFFETRNVPRRDLTFSGAWAEREYIEELKKLIPLANAHAEGNLGQNLAFGEAFLLNHFRLSFVNLGVTFTTDSHEAELSNIVSVLNKSNEANAVLVGDDKMSTLSILCTLGIQAGRQLSIFDSATFISTYADKASFESNFIKLLNEASHAGNLILVITDLPEFIDNARTLGTNVVTLMDPYLRGAHLQVIATASEGSYARHFEHEPALLALFEKIQIEPESGESILRFAESRVFNIEKQEKVFFASGAVLAVRDSVLRFSPEMLIHATDDLLEEVVARAKSNKLETISASDVLSQVEARTGVPQGEASKNEKEILSKLEELLNARVIGQTEAVSAVSSALRRARAGISNENRPMGSFLFLGPTGVGKTETTKALADIFFGTKAPLVRFDMSEYNSTNSLNRLIGTLETEGTLSSKLREHEYGVLLLDEFEKTDKAVIDLFLQILDEGFFSDGQGKRVNVRNHIVIATSNAASDMIFNLVKDGKNLTTEKDTIINTLIDRALFKPELLNRFDGIVLFNPLTKESLKQIASLMLISLDKRLKAKGLTLTINDALIDFLVSKGQDPKFGARPLNRAIQDNIESLIAKRMLDGTLKSGDKIILNPEDLL